MKKNITATTKKINKLSLSTVLEMHGVFMKYYHNCDFQSFIEDMNKKTGVIILRENETRKIVGFSSWKELNIIDKGKRLVGVFSGDTILEKKYWGNKELHKKFVRTLFKIKVKNPRVPVFWLLISKGYKTYLLLANNFPVYYPDYKGRGEYLSGVVDSYCECLYPSYYDSDKKLLDFGED